MIMEVRAAPFEQMVRRLIAEQNAVGIGTAAAVNGRLTYDQGFGFRDREAELPVSRETIFGIGSIGKSFTCAGIMRLQEEGRLRVDDPVLRYIPEYRTPNPDYARATTIHHLMTHTAGLPPLPSLYYCMARSILSDPETEGTDARTLAQQHPPIETYEQLLEYIANTPMRLLGPPGFQASYSNDSYALLGLIIERVSGRSYPEFITNEILQPCGMARSTFDAAHALQDPNAAMLYLPAAKEGHPPARRAPLWWSSAPQTAAGFLLSTPADMLRYLELYRTGGVVAGVRVLREESVQAMTHPHVPLMPGQFYGYGLRIVPDCHGVKLVEHGGNAKGASAWASVVPERGVTAIALANLNTVAASVAAHGLVNTLMDLAPETSRWSFADQPCEPEALSAYAGTYRSDEGATFTVAVEEGRLHFLVQTRRIEARPIGRHLFGVRLSPEETPVLFLEDSTGRIEAVFAGMRVIRRLEEERLPAAG